jgi:hypothetical protein
MMLGGIMRDVLNKAGRSSIILQPIPEDGWYFHTVASSYGRQIDIGIEPVPQLPQT